MSSVKLSVNSFIRPEFLLDGLVCIGTDLSEEQLDSLSDHWILCARRQFDGTLYYYVTSESSDEALSLIRKAACS